jgi:hypothetical protein
VDVSKGTTVTIMVESRGGLLPSRGFSLTVCAEVPFDVRSCDLCLGRVSLPLPKVSDVSVGMVEASVSTDNLPPVPFWRVFK